MPIIEVSHISKQYPTRRGTSLLLGRGGLGSLFATGGDKGFFALEDVSLEVDAGESLGIIGRNGSGKSTLLKILAGVTLPSSGSVKVTGRVASLLELGAGFHPMLTGRENIYLNAGLLGMRAAQVDQVFDEIVAFSGIADFIDQPVDTYSSGMYVRIAFSVAVYANPDIFLVDEVLAVGDEEFQRKCRAKIGELREQGKTIVFVSHDLGIVHTLCDRVVLLHKGAMVSRDTPQQTIDYYLRQIGRESGIHSMSVGGMDVIFNHGRVSLFWEQREVTGPTGIFVALHHLGQDHYSTYADWRVLESGADFCVAEGLMGRLPAKLRMAIRVQGAEVSIECHLVCLGKTPLDAVFLRLQLPAAFSRWYLEDLGHDLPEISPGDVDWAMVVKPDAHCRQALLLDTSGGYAPVQTVFEPEETHALIQGYNCDYISGARILECATHIPSSMSPLEPGEYRLGALRLNLGLGHDKAQAMAATWESQRDFALGENHARLHNGYIVLHREATPLTHDIHAHTQVRVGGMWIISRLFQWSQAWQEDGWIHMTGTSARVPFALHWMLRTTESGVLWRVLLETEKPVELEEYNISIGLVPAYSAWKTEKESGAFPAFDMQKSEWVHLNKDFAVGDWICAGGIGLPELRLEAGADSPALRMTALNTGGSQNARVLQALRSPEREGLLEFSPGSHVLFEGSIRLSGGGGQ